MKILIYLFFSAVSSLWTLLMGITDTLSEWETDAEAPMWETDVR